MEEIGIEPHHVSQHYTCPLPITDISPVKRHFLSSQTVDGYLSDYTIMKTFKVEADSESNRKSA